MFPSNTEFLVVDDFSSVRDLVRNSLNELGYFEITEAENGLDAWQLLNSSIPDVIISDWDMPHMSGLDFLKKCKADKKLKNIPFIILAADGSQKNIQLAAKAGVSEYILKPIKIEVLKEKLDKVFLLHGK
jgi:two-component system chemotaxis response regulator CheY